jgi:hypothetical protein
MMTKYVKYTGTIDTLTRRQSSVNGNPRWSVTFTDGRVMHTAIDAQVGYAISNSEYQGKPVTVTLDKGEIVGIEVTP